MRRRPPRSTRTDTLFPYTTLFRSDDHALELLLDQGGNRLGATNAQGPADADPAEPNFRSLLQLFALLSSHKWICKQYVSDCQRFIFIHIFLYITDLLHGLNCQNCGTAPGHRYRPAGPPAVAPSPRSPRGTTQREARVPAKHGR